MVEGKLEWDWGNIVAVDESGELNRTSAAGARGGPPSWHLGPITWVGVQAQSGRDRVLHPSWAPTSYCWPPRQNQSEHQVIIHQSKYPISTYGAHQTSSNMRCVWFSALFFYLAMIVFNVLFANLLLVWRWLKDGRNWSRGLTLFGFEDKAWKIHTRSRLEVLWLLQPVMAIETADKQRNNQ